MKRASGRGPRAADLDNLRRLARLLDSQFTVPGTRFRFGLDPILGLIPGIGDAVTPFFSALVVIHGYRVRIPRIVLARMALNVLVDAATGVVPVIGDLFDFAWRANDKNLQLLEKHAAAPGLPTKGDWIFVSAVVGFVALSALIPIALLALVLASLGRGVV